MTIQLLTVFVFILIGLVGYLHYTTIRLQDEIKAVWLQISVLAAATAKQFTKIEEEKIKKNDKE